MARLSKKELDALGVTFKKPGVKHSLRVWKKVCALYAEGKSVSEICAMPGMPSKSALYLWKETGDFAIRWQAAKKQRADFHAEKAIKAADDAVDKEDAPAARLKFDAHCKAAEWANPSEYGKKITHGGDKDNPIRFVVSTGFPEPNEHQKHPKLNSDGTIQKISGPDGPFHEEEGP